MGRVRHPIYSNSTEVKCGYRPKKGINIARRCVNGYSITAAPARSVTHVVFWWRVYQAQSNRSKYAMWPVTWATGSVYFSIRGYEVPSEPSELSGTPGCVRWKLGLLLMHDQVHGEFSGGVSLSKGCFQSTPCQSIYTECLRNLEKAAYFGQIGGTGKWPRLEPSFYGWHPSSRWWS